MSPSSRPWLDETVKSSVPLTADQLEMLGCGLSSLIGDSRWSPDEINQVSDLLAGHQSHLRRLTNSTPSKGA